MKRITEEETVNYTPLYGPPSWVCRNAAAFTLNPSQDSYPGLFSNASWEDVTYYGNDVGNYKASPLEIMLAEWNTQEDNDR